MLSKVSIVIPIYNVEKYIRKCITTIINQKYSNLEIILVNDGSPDNSPEICEEYAKMDSRIKVIHKENGGLSDARNAGLLNATGDYIIFIDSDDYVEVNMVEKAMEVAANHEPDVVIWGYYVDYLDKGEAVTNSLIHIPTNGIFYKDNIMNLNVSAELVGILGYAWNKMYKIDLLRDNDHKFTKGLSLVEDIVFNSSVLLDANKIVFIDVPLIHYVQRNRETLGNKFYKNFFELKKIALEAIEKLLIAWNIDSKRIDSLIGTIGFGNLKLTIKKLSTANNYTHKEKVFYLNGILVEEITKDILRKSKVFGLKDNLIKNLVKYKQSQIILFLYKTSNYPKKEEG
ncbi:glycosyltransferase family 2 protein [Salirhabdus salicampi]|uniref:glycosyltransferase family 2 protein n=1 Tax=Salirhabdus salicampi TaxID=476102 RepID=UPI0020C38314|nr:glycosyltransferase family 2 protein [Salirhabdus salicampi]MCP8617525.1 glycosyltransferase [Salirhabdus salicampi]